MFVKCYLGSCYYFVWSFFYPRVCVALVGELCFALSNWLATRGRWEKTHPLSDFLIFCYYFFSENNITNNMQGLSIWLCYSIKDMKLATSSWFRFILVISSSLMRNLQILDQWMILIPDMVQIYCILWLFFHSFILHICISQLSLINCSYNQCFISQICWGCKISIFNWTIFHNSRSF